MALVIDNLALLAASVSFLFICLIKLWSPNKPKTLFPINYPFIGLLPALLHNAHRIHEFATDVLRESGGSHVVKGPWFANLDMLVTCDTANIHHILTTNFSNYPKGPEFKKIFDLLGDGIFNVDSELWEIQRKTTMSLIKHANFLKLLQRSNWNKVEKGLLPILERSAELGEEMDLLEVLRKYSYDISCKVVLGYDPCTLSVDLMDIPSVKAFVDAEKAIFYRHI